MTQFNDELFHQMYIRTFDPLAARHSITAFLKHHYHTTFGNRGMLVGLSGGVDSAVVAALLKEASIPLKVMLLPAGEQPETIRTAELMIDYLRIEPQDITPVRNIGPMLDAQCGVVCGNPQGYPGCEEYICRGNRAARQRMIELFDQARKASLVVCGTENWTEHLLGYFTAHGDSASHLEPIRGLVKAYVRIVAQSFPGFPEEIIIQAPSANLWEDQTDEGELGFPYDVADAYILSRGNWVIRDMLGICPKQWQAVESRITFTKFKREEVPTWEMPNLLV